MSPHSRRSETLSILRRRENRVRILKRIDDELKRIYAEQEARQAAAQREESERLFVAEQGERASFDEEKARCAADFDYWVEKYVWCYDPRRVGQRDDDGTLLNAYFRFHAWPRQKEFTRWLDKLFAEQMQGAGPKSRDQGVSTLCGLWALHKWLFMAGFKATFGSREAELVDKLNDPDSIFEKIRITRNRLPTWMLPAGFDRRRHDVHMLMSNPENGAIIAGEAGDEMGRGGRSSIYFLDEVAFVARPAKAEAAILANTECAVYVSTVNRQGDFFDQKRFSLPADQVFTLHWRDDPRKDDAWAAKKKASLVDPTAFAREYDIDSSASTDNIAIPAKTVQAAMRLYGLVAAMHASMLAAPFVIPRSGTPTLGGDVGGGKAKSVSIMRHGAYVWPVERRTDGDTTDTAFWMLEHAFKTGMKVLNFDTVGIGEGVKSTLMKTTDPRFTPITRNPVNTGIEPDVSREWPDGRFSDEIFGNLKAELWWLARVAFERSADLVLWIETGGAKGVQYQVRDCICLPNDQVLAAQLSLPKWLHNTKGQITIEKKEDLKKRGIASPDEAEAFVLTFLSDPNDAIPVAAPNPDDFKRANWAKVGDNKGGGGGVTSEDDDGDFPGFGV